MLLRRLRDDASFTPINGVRPLPSVNSPVIPLPPVSGGLRLASGHMRDYTAEGGYSAPTITFPMQMDEYAGISGQQAGEPQRINVAAKPIGSFSESDKQAAPTVPPVVLNAPSEDYMVERTFQPAQPRKGLLGVAQKVGRVAAVPAGKVRELASMLYREGVNPFYDYQRGQYRGLQPISLPKNDIEQMADKDYIENYYPRRRV